MPDFYTTIGGQRRRIQYTLDDREAVEELFTRPDGTPGSLWALATSGSVRAIVAVLWGGLRYDKTVTLDLCKQWLSEHLAAGGTVMEVMKPVGDHILSTGVCGFTVAAEPEAPAEGKAQAAIPAAQ